MANTLRFHRGSQFIIICHINHKSQFQSPFTVHKQHLQKKQCYYYYFKKDKHHRTTFTKPSAIWLSSVPCPQTQLQLKWLTDWLTVAHVKTERNAIVHLMSFEEWRCWYLPTTHKATHPNHKTGGAVAVAVAMQQLQYNIIIINRELLVSVVS